MSNREQLFENYEDALFAILMDALARAEGERLLELNQQLQDDPSAAVSDDVRQRCVDVINREFAKKRRAVSIQHAKKVMRILPWAVIIAMALMAIAFAAFPSFRTGVFNLLKTTTPEYNSWSFNESPIIENELDSELSFTLTIPSEFKVEDIYSDSFIETVDFVNVVNNESRFSIIVSSSSDNILYTDNENYTHIRTFEFDNYYAELYSDDENTWIVGTDSNIPFYYLLEATNVDESVVVSIAQSFKYKN